jgi:hypothetical protein
MALVADEAWADAACRLFPLAVTSAAKGKLVPPADAEILLASPHLDAVEQACAALQAWCWVRGLPPLDRLVAHPRTRDPFRPVADYEAFYEALGWDVATERSVLAYPWRKVMEPTSAEVARAARLLREAAPPLRSFRRLDLELDLREADGARGRRRPVPEGFASWEAVAGARDRTLRELAPLGVTLHDLRPAGAAPYPPPRPRDNALEHM